MGTSLVSASELPHVFRSLLTRSAMASVETIRRIRDDVLTRELELALTIVLTTANRRGTIWLCGSKSGISSALDAERQLTMSIPKAADPVRARVLATNPVSHESFSRDNRGYLAAELMTFGRREIDCLWCFAVDPGDEDVLNAARMAKEKLKINVIAFTGHPGTPLIRFADAKVQIQPAGEDLHEQRVQEAHTLLYQTIISFVRQSKREYV